MNTPLNDALKPCPFCGSQCTLLESRISCDSCLCNVGRLKNETDEMLIAAWNTRANTPDSSAAQGAMGDLQNEITLLRQEIEQQTIWKNEAIQHMNFLAGKLMHYVPTPAFRVSVRKYGVQPSDATAQTNDEITRLTLELQNANELVKHWRSLANTNAQHSPAQSKPDHIEYDLELAKRIVRDNFHKALATKKG